MQYVIISSEPYEDTEVTIVATKEEAEAWINEHCRPQGAANRREVLHVFEIVRELKVEPVEVTTVFRLT